MIKDTTYWIDEAYKTSVFPLVSVYPLPHNRQAPSHIIHPPEPQIVFVNGSRKKARPSFNGQIVAGFRGRTDRACQWRTFDVHVTACKIFWGYGRKLSKSKFSHATSSIMNEPIEAYEKNLHNRASGK